MFKCFPSNEQWVYCHAFSLCHSVLILLLGATLMTLQSIGSTPPYLPRVDTFTSKVKPQTHGEREAGSYKNFCAQQSDITISLALWTTDKCCKSSELGKIASSRVVSRAIPSETCIPMENRFTLLASRLPCVCSITSSAVDVEMVVRASHRRIFGLKAVNVYFNRVSTWQRAIERHAPASCVVPEHGVSTSVMQHSII